MNIKNNALKKSRSVFINNKYIEVKGGKSLEGKIKISGAKNSALVLMATSILSKGQINLFNVPQITDVAIMSKILTAMGMNIKSNKDKLEINIKSNLHQPQEVLFDLFNSLNSSWIKEIKYRDY